MQFLTSASGILAERRPFFVHKLDSCCQSIAVPTVEKKHSVYIHKNIQKAMVKSMNENCCSYIMFHYAALSIFLCNNFCILLPYNVTYSTDGLDTKTFIVAV